MRFLLTVIRSQQIFLLISEQFGSLTSPTRLLLLNSHSNDSTAKHPQAAWRVLAANPDAKGRKQTREVADSPTQQGPASAPCSASPPTHCLLFPQQPVRHEPVVFVGEMSGLEGKVICYAWFLQLQTWINCFSALGQGSSSAWSQQGCLGPCSPGTNRGRNLESHLCCLGYLRTNVFPISRNHPHPSAAAL